MAWGRGYSRKSCSSCSGNMSPCNITMPITKNMASAPQRSIYVRNPDPLRNGRGDLPELVDVHIGNALPIPGHKGNPAQSDVVNKIDGVQGHGLHDDRPSLGRNLIHDLGVHRGNIVTVIIFGGFPREYPIGKAGLSGQGALGYDGVPNDPLAQDPALKFQDQG